MESKCDTHGFAYDPNGSCIFCQQYLESQQLLSDANDCIMKITQSLGELQIQVERLIQNQRI